MDSYIALLESLATSWFPLLFITFVLLVIVMRSTRNIVPTEVGLVR